MIEMGAEEAAQSMSPHDSPTHFDDKKEKQKDLASSSEGREEPTKLDDESHFGTIAESSSAILPTRHWPLLPNSEVEANSKMGKKRLTLSRKR